MRKIFAILILSIILGLIPCMSSLINPTEDSIDILFTVSGIIFSVGATLIVTSSTQNIHNTEYKKEIQKEKYNIAREYVWSFFILSLMYSLLFGFNVLGDNYVLHIGDYVKIDIFIVMITMLILFNLLYIYTFLRILKFNDKLEEKVDRELYG